MNIRKAEDKDIDSIADIYEYARQQMRLNGNPDQWGNGYPSLELIRKDIRQGVSYVAEEEAQICGVFAFIKGEDPTYQRIENGAWLDDEPYGTLHRIASNGKKKGIFRECIRFCEAQEKNIRVDTHECNLIMQHLLEKNGYQRCGRIYVEDGSPRIAYQKGRTDEETCGSAGMSN